MTTKITVQVTCPECHTQGEFTVYKSINTKESPALKEKVRDGSLFQFVCPQCGAKTTVDYPFLYHQPEDCYMINYGNLADGRKALEMLRGKGVALKDWAKEMEKTTRPYVLRAVDDRLAFREKLFIFDAGLDDRLIEIYKFMVLYQYAAAGKAQGGEQAYFYTDSKGHHHIQLVRGKQTLGIAGFVRRVYNEIHQAYDKTLRDIRRSEPVIDKAWAQKFLQEHGQTEAAE